MATSNNVSDSIAKQLAEELFDGTVDTVVVFSDVDIETAAITKTERRKHEKRLDKVWRSIPNETTRETLLELIAAIEPETVGLYVCRTKGEIVDVLTQVYDRLKAARRHDACDAGKLLDDIGFIRLWIDR